jgi:hypothetical protein
MTSKELNKNILKICKSAEKYIEEQKKDKTLEKPIMNDLVKTKKAMAYEDILEQIRKYSKSKED